MTLEILKPGTKVGLSPDGKIDGVVTSAMIAPGNQVQYKVAWWNGRQRYEEWFSASEIERRVEQTETRSIGFVTGGTHGEGTDRVG